MTSIMDILPILVGNPTDDYQEYILFMISGIITIICILFFLKLFLLIGGLIPNRR